MSIHQSFDRFVIDRDARLLLDNGQERPLEPRVFDTLVYLIDHRHRVVSKDELVDRIWGGRAISDSAISSTIRAARRILSDDRRRQAYIRTYHRRGFRFVAEVTDLRRKDSRTSKELRQVRRVR